MIKSRVTAVLLCGLLSACGTSEAPVESSNGGDGSNANAGEHMLSDQQRAIENAKSTAAAMEESNRAKQQALEEAKP